MTHRKKSPQRLSRRSLLTAAPLGALGVGLVAVNVPAAKAGYWTDADTQWNVAMFGFLGVNEIDGIYGPRTTEAVRRYQYQRNLKSVDGIADPRTYSDFGHTLRNVQDIVGVVLDGQAGPETRQGVTTTRSATA
ncbi:MAG: peptidoglycan-binding domain-containing protein [Propionibacteriaceae bacterium]|nr:peptidoglycan-binding domain-containing protein [Propionibacteriaceae bacterium]